MMRTYICDNCDIKMADYELVLLVGAVLSCPRCASLDVFEFDSHSDDPEYDEERGIDFV